MQPYLIIVTPHSLASVIQTAIAKVTLETNTILIGPEWFKFDFGVQLHLAQFLECGFTWPVSSALCWVESALIVTVFLHIGLSKLIKIHLVTIKINLRTLSLWIYLREKYSISWHWLELITFWFNAWLLSPKPLSQVLCNGPAKIAILAG